MRAFAILLVVGCSHHVVQPDAQPARCGDPLPAWADGSSGALVASCGVTVEPIAGGVVKLHYGDATPTSWAVVGVPAGDASARIGGDGGVAAVCSDAMTVTVDDSCRVRAVLADGTVAVADAAPLAVDDAAHLARAGQGDHVYGLGERTGGLDRRGRAWTFWNTDAYDPAVGGWHPGQDPMYQAIPLEVHLAGATAFGLFTDATRRMTIDLSDPSADRYAIAGARGVDQYVLAGPRMADVLDRYTQLVGRPALPPRWALGFHQSRWGYADAQTVLGIAQQYRALGLPADAIWLDIQHLRGFRSFTFDPAAFPDPSGLASQLAQLGFRLVTIEDPGIKIDPGWDVYDSGRPYFLRDGGGAIYSGTAWPGAAAFPDFSDPAARAWWGQQVGSVLDRGVAGIWLDVNEPTTFPEGGGGTTVPDDLRVAGDGEPTTMAALHDAYALFEARATYDAIAARGQRPFVLSRAGYAGIQRYAAVWTGDTPSTWQGLRQTLPMLLGLGLSGEPFCGSDIGGYSGHATAELYARWLALGSVSPFARAHVTSGVPGQEPWMFGDEVLAAAKGWLVQRYRLLPYLYSVADEAARTGAPVLRPLVWEFPEDPQVATMDDEAMLGASLLVAPVMDAGATTRAVYLPAGRWFELASGAIYDGPATITVSLRLAALPMFARAGAILPEDAGNGALAIEVYSGAAPSSSTLFEDDGGSLGGAASHLAISVEPRADGARITLAHDGAVPARSVTVRVHRVDGAVTGVTADGTPVPYAYDPDDRSLAVTVPDAASRELVLTYDPAIADPRPPVAVTFEVHVPAGTPADPPIAVATSATGWAQTPLPWVSPGVARGTVTVPRGDWLDYKYTRGSWDTVEKAGDCSELADRYRAGAAGTRVDTVATWRDRCP
ncbi:MAG: TIM-barrel domain-containing protein [Acidobacteriota bacterium]